MWPQCKLASFHSSFSSIFRYQTFQRCVNNTWNYPARDQARAANRNRIYITNGQMNRNFSHLLSHQTSPNVQEKKVSKFCQSARSLPLVGLIQIFTMSFFSWTLLKLEGVCNKMKNFNFFNQANAYAYSIANDCDQSQTKVLWLNKTVMTNISTHIIAHIRKNNTSQSVTTKIGRKSRKLFL